MADHLMADEVINPIHDPPPMPLDILTSTVNYKGYDYTINTRNFSMAKKHHTGYYNCAHRRLGQGCTATMRIVVTYNPEATNFKTVGEHACDALIEGNAVDVRDLMLEAASDKALADPGQTANAIAKAVIAKFLDEYQGKSTFFNLSADF